MTSNDSKPCAGHTILEKINSDSQDASTNKVFIILKVALKVFYKCL